MVLGGVWLLAGPCSWQGDLQQRQSGPQMKRTRPHLMAMAFREWLAQALRQMALA